jgi:hypothetical protein
VTTAITMRGGSQLFVEELRGGGWVHDAPPDLFFRSHCSFWQGVIGHPCVGLATGSSRGPSFSADVRPVPRPASAVRKSLGRVLVAFALPLRSLLGALLVRR